MADQPEEGAMVVKIVVQNCRRDLPLSQSLVLVSSVAERDDVSEGHTLAPLGHRGMRRCRHASRVGRVQASAPEFGELLGKRSALVVTGSSGGRTQR